MSDPKPLIRHVEGGVVSADAYPSAGEPDWKQECARLEEVLFQVMCERDAAKAQLGTLCRELGLVPRDASPTPWGGYMRCRSCDSVLTAEEFEKGSHCDGCQQVVE
jgi:hypothetical protein